MKIEQTPIEDCFVLHPKLFKDERGYFFERYNKKTFEKLLKRTIHFVQDNESLSTYGVVRGFHAQKGADAQAKLVEVAQGKVLDVVVDIRSSSPTYGKSFSIELSGKNKKQLFIPKGLLHGFAVLSRKAKFIYKCDEFYNKSAEIGVRHDDPEFAIDWKIPIQDRIISEKDKNLPYFKDLQL